MLPAAISGSSRLPPGPRDILAAFSPAVAETPSMYAAAWSATDWSAACFARSCCTRTTAAAPAATMLRPRIASSNPLGYFYEGRHASTPLHGRDDGPSVSELWCGPSLHRRVRPPVL